jgi:hypothetical protein
MFDWDTNALLVSMLAGAAGFILAAYGRSMGRIPHGIVGLVLMVYPMFVSSALAMALVAVGLLAALWLATRLGM